MRRLHLFVAIAIGLALLGASSFSYAAGMQYRRWASPKNFSCAPNGSGVAVSFTNQNVEFNGLPSNATYTTNYIDNGVLTRSGPYPVEQTSGSVAYAPFSESFASYPLDFEFRIDTLVGGYPVYRSSLHVACFSNSSGSTEAVQRDTGPAPTQYRRWTAGKTFACTNTGGNVRVDLNNQNVEFNDLPVNAQYVIHYIDNGVDTPSGPFTVEQTTGTRNYAAFSEFFASYPLSFRFRIDTLIGGAMAYHSTIGVDCTGDASGIAPIVLNVPERIFADGFDA